MKARTFIIRLALFLLPLLAAYLFIEWELSMIGNTQKLKHRYMEKNAKDVQVLILGSSQPFFGINPDYMTYKAYNLAGGAQSLYYDEQMTYRYLNKMQSLKCVIIPITYFSFNYELCDNEEKWRGYFYYRYWGIKHPELDMYNAKLYSYSALYGLERIKYLVKDRFHVADTLANLLDNGFMANDTLPNNNISDSLGRARVKLHTSMMRSSRYANNVKQLDSFIQTLTLRNIKVIFITVPVYKTYYQYCSPAVLENNRETISTLALKYGCSYFDHFKDSRFTKKDFWDNDHLNINGAKKFTLLLNRQVDSVMRAYMISSR